MTSEDRIGRKFLGQPRELAPTYKYVFQFSRDCTHVKRLDTKNKYKMVRQYIP